MPISLTSVETESLLPDSTLIDWCEAHYGLRIANVFLSAPPVGGDLWGLLPIDETRLAIFCADVCGHGVEVAPHARFVHALLRTPMLDLSRPTDVLELLNRHLYTLLPKGRFVAIWYGVIDIGRNDLTWSAATFLPQLMSPPGAAYDLLPGSGLPLGFRPDSTYEAHARAFCSGARLVLYSDALTETPLPPKSVFSSDSVCAFVNSLDPSLPPQRVTKALIDKIDLGLNRLIDDLTLLAIFRDQP